MSAFPRAEAPARGEIKNSIKLQTLACTQLDSALPPFHNSAPSGQFLGWGRRVHLDLIMKLAGGGVTCFLLTDKLLRGGNC